jgi:hypothetical protein
MDSNLTVNGLDFKLIASDIVGGSVRRETSRGATLPTEILIKHQDYVDSATKVAGKRSLVRVDYHMAMTDGIVRPVSYYAVFTRPNDPLVTVTISNTLEAILTNLMHSATNTSGLDLKDEILGNREQ